MITVNPLPKTKTEEKLENLLKANNEHVSIGHFSESGTHYSGFTYPELMMLHHNGTNHIPPRPVLEFLFHNQPKILANPAVNKAVKRYMDSKMTQKDLTAMLKVVGLIIGEEEVDIFGSRMLTSNSRITQERKGENAPLVDTQDLVNETSYKDSVTKQRRKVL
jgi:hypothetical protein